jgi:hypothetical protein
MCVLVPQFHPLAREMQRGGVEAVGHAANGGPLCTRSGLEAANTDQNQWWGEEERTVRVITSKTRAHETRRR